MGVGVGSCVWGGVCGEVGVEVGVGLGRWMWVWGVGLGVERWVWGFRCGCGCVEVGVGVGRLVWLWGRGCGSLLVTLEILKSLIEAGGNVNHTAKVGKIKHNTLVS